jgi:hypothetical protein
MPLKEKFRKSVAHKEAKQACKRTFKAQGTIVVKQQNTNQPILENIPTTSFTLK